MYDIAEKMFEDNQKLAYACLKRYFHNLLMDEDMQQVALMGLWKACMSFDPERKTTLSTYAYAYIRNEVLQELRRRSKHRSWESLDEILPDTDGLTVEDTLADSSLEDMWKLVEIKSVLEGLSERDKKIIHLISQGYTQAEVGERVGESQVQVSRIVSKIKRKVGERI